MATRTASRPGQSSTSSRLGERHELDDFARFCELLTLDNGKSFVLEPFQRVMLADYFGGATETLILLPKKNGKTTLMAALALYHLISTPDAECVIGAAARRQAGIMFRQIRGFFNKCPELHALMEPTRREMYSLRDEGHIEIMSSDATTGDGVIPTLALVDELHRHKNGDLYGVFRDGLGPRNGQIITISTAGDDEASALGEMRRRAYTLPGFRKDGVYRYSQSTDGHYAMHEWALDPDDDRDDVAVVKQANPASWQTTELLTRRFTSPSTTPWQWARFACGVWLQGEDTAIGPVEWAACGADAIPDPGAATVRMGLDLGFKEDTTGIVVHWIDDDGVAWLGDVEVLVPPAEKGVALRKSLIIAALEKFRDEYGAGEIVLDPENDGEIIAQDLEELDFEVVAHSQKPSVMAQAAARFSAAVREEKLRHPRDSTLTRHVLNAHPKSTESGGWRFVKENKQSKKHIDALIAAAMVHNYGTDQTTPAVMPSFEVLA